MKKFWQFIVCLLICEGAGGVGAIFTTPAIASWYATLTKPSFSPPNWLFGPAWTILFLLMAISLYLIWQSKENKKAALWVFAIQLALNILWSVIFFGQQQPFIAFIEIIILWLAILMNIIYFYRVNKTAGLLLVPYILWVSFASVLNYVVWQLNK